ncbi:MAG: hypothetical protein IK117_01765 [Bacteroidales bacterium]|nr:hypothetical protein [Bacteroidales bacterium]
MDPSTKNWLVLYIDEFQESVSADPSKLALYLGNYDNVLDFSHFYLHDSGLFYGHIATRRFCSFANSESWSRADNFKIAVVEGFVLTYLFLQKQRISQGERIQDVVQECVGKIYEFYVLFTMNDVQSQKYRTIFQKSQDKMSAVEQVVDGRVSNPSMLERDFWKGSQFNIFTALDVVYFAFWLQGIYEYDRRNTIKNEIVSLMDKASRVEKKSNKNGQSTVSYFIASGNFGGAGDYVAQTEIDFSECRRKESAMMRRIMFEYVVYVCLVDNQLEYKEIDFLQKIESQLDVPENEAQESLFVIDSFLANYAEHIFYLQYGEGVNLIRKAFIMRFQSFVTKNKAKIVEEVLQSKELVELLRKSVSENLSDEEKQKVKTQIGDILKTIPSLAIFMIPGGSFILPVLLKILPEDILIPSSFINKKNEK